MEILLRPENNVYWRVYAGGGQNINYSSPTPPVNDQWIHHAIVRRSGVTYYYFNGVQKGSITDTTNYTATYCIVGNYSSVYPTGYITDVRIIKGTALYTSNFYPTSSPLTAVSNTTLLLNGTNIGILDQSRTTNLETVGNSQLSASIKKYGTASIYNSGAGNYPKAIWNPNLELGADSFTIEFWVYPISGSSLLCWSTDWHYGIVWNYGGASSNKIGVWASSNGTSWNIFNSDPAGNGISSGTISANTWAHIAWVRNGSSWALYINGTSSWTGTSSATIITRNTDTLRIGGDWPNSGPGGFNGYIDEFRLTKGYARYTSNFTAPTSAFITK
jgi:hypothetical protein